MGSADPTEYSVVMHASCTGVRWSNVRTESTDGQKRRTDKRKDVMFSGMSIRDAPHSAVMIARF